MQMPKVDLVVHAYEGALQHQLHRGALQLMAGRLLSPGTRLLVFCTQNAWGLEGWSAALGILSFFD